MGLSSVQVRPVFFFIFNEAHFWPFSSSAEPNNVCCR